MITSATWKQDNDTFLALPPSIIVDVVSAAYPSVSHGNQSLKYLCSHGVHTLTHGPHQQARPHVPHLGHKGFEGARKLQKSARARDDGRGLAVLLKRHGGPKHGAQVLVLCKKDQLRAKRLGQTGRRRRYSHHRWRSLFHRDPATCKSPRLSLHERGYNIH